MIKTTRKASEVKSDIINRLGKTSNKLEHTHKINPVEQIKQCIQDEYNSSDPKDRKKITNTAKLAMKNVQENINHGGMDYFKDNEYYGEIDQDFYNRLMQGEMKKYLEEICVHKNSFFTDRKYSFYKTNYTDSAQEIRDFLAKELHLTAKVPNAIGFGVENKHEASLQLMESVHPIEQGKVTVSNTVNNILEPYKITNNLNGPENFKAGGKYKQFDPSKGLLRGKGKKIAKEFKKEQDTSNYINLLSDEYLKASLKANTSFQKPLSKEQAKELGLSGDYHYATVQLYDKKKVGSVELDDLLVTTKLTKPQLAEIGKQIISIIKFFHMAKIAHKDFHMHNILVHTINNNAPPKEGNELAKDTQMQIKMIDFGRVEIHSNETDPKNGNTLYDINYLFFKQAEHGIETFKRNVLRNEDSEAQRKHYPLHKLAKEAGKTADKIDKFLKDLGNYLKNNLRKDKSNSEEIFDNCATIYHNWILEEEALII